MGLISVSTFMQTYWWIVLGALAGAFTGSSNGARTDTGRMRLDAFRLAHAAGGKRVPQLRPVALHAHLGDAAAQRHPHFGKPCAFSKDSTGNRVLALAIDQAATTSPPAIRSPRARAMQIFP